MKLSKKYAKLELKRMQASFNQKENSKKPITDICLICKQEAGKNFIFKYKRNNELKGKICISCYKNNQAPAFL